MPSINLRITAKVGSCGRSDVVSSCFFFDPLPFPTRAPSASAGGGSTACSSSTSLTPSGRFWRSSLPLGVAKTRSSSFRSAIRRCRYSWGSEAHTNRACPGLSAAPLRYTEQKKERRSSLSWKGKLQCSHFDERSWSRLTVDQRGSARIAFLVFDRAFDMFDVT